MSRKILINSLSKEEKENIVKELEIKIEGSKYVHNSQPTYLQPYDISGKYVYIPFAYAKGKPRPERKNLGRISCKFNGKLREYQEPVRDESIDRLNKTGSSVISAACGFGKTALAIYIATRIKLKTLIVVNRIVLMKQWKESIKFFVPTATIQCLTAKSKDKDADFYIMNAMNIPKLGKEFYKHIGLLIIDELHLIMSEVLSKCMQTITPRYLLGLSATPYRTDGFDPLINLYFGKHRITRKLYREHIAYRVSTGFKPEFELAKNGRVNWSTVIDSQALSPERNELIIKIIKHFKDRVFLVLVKRVAQGELLVERLQEEKINVTSLIGKQQEYDVDARVLVGTNGKCSTGFDHPRLNTLLLGADMVSYFIQTLGRIFRTRDGIPIVFDLVDNYGLLIKHYKERRYTYIEHGGKIKDFNLEFPDIKMA